MSSTTPPPDARLVTGLGGEERIWQPRPGLVVVRGRGVFSLPLAEGITDFVRPILEAGTRIHVFGDLEHVDFHTQDFREHVTAFTLEHLSDIEAVDILFASKFVALGVSAFRHAVGPRVTVYTDRSSFTRALEAATVSSTD